ncbi:MAG: hypothetical protein JWL59_988 [Chthoniobacteraceae bacterium]|nr:hypothetical protein [Chthoniobacteraceae bacterium]
MPPAMYGGWLAMKGKQPAVHGQAPDIDEGKVSVQIWLPGVNRLPLPGKRRAIDRTSFSVH